MTFIKVQLLSLLDSKLHFSLFICAIKKGGGGGAGGDYILHRTDWGKR